MPTNPFILFYPSLLLPLIVAHILLDNLHINSIEQSCGMIRLQKITSAFKPICDPVKQCSDGFRSKILKVEKRD